MILKCQFIKLFDYIIQKAELLHSQTNRTTLLVTEKLAKFQLNYLLYILNSIWVLRTLNTGQCLLFHVFRLKNAIKKKQRKIIDAK